MSQGFARAGQAQSPMGAVITERIACGGASTTISATPAVIWGDSISASDYPSRVFTFQAYGAVTRAALVGTVQLYNVTTASAVTSLSFTGTTTLVLQSAAIALSSTCVYEVRISVTGYVAGPDALQLSSVIIVVR